MARIEGMVLVMGAFERVCGRRWALVGVVVGLVLVAGGGWALAASGSGVIHACASKKTGALRVARGCKASEKAVKWSVRGPRGLRGVRGLQGPRGVKGPPGPATGPAGGALKGSYPNPKLHVSGGDSGATACKNGEALTGLSTGAALSCKPGVYSDSNDNVAAGPSPLGALTTGSGNSAFGQSALQSNTTGSGNSAVGQEALLFNSTGGGNSAVGSGGLLSNTTGSNDSAVGSGALAFDTTGSGNSAVGAGAGGSLTTGSSNALFGKNAGGNYTGAESSNIDITNSGTAGESNTIRIGTQGTGGGQQNRAFMAGISGTTVGGTNAAVIVDSNGQLGTVSSSRRFKQDINPLSQSALAPLMSLRPVSFHYKPQYVHGQANTLQYGLIAEQVAKVYPNLVVYGRDGKPATVAYQELPALLLAQAQRQQHTLTRQARQIASLQAQIGQIERQLKHH